MATPADLAAALVLGRRFIDEPNSSRKVALLADALKAEGDRRAAGMRARCVSHCQAAGGAGELLAAELSALSLDTEAK